MKWSEVFVVVIVNNNAAAAAAAAATRVLLRHAPGEYVRYCCDHNEHLCFSSA